MGHTFCSGNVQSCVPDATTQSCYDGPAGTAGVGACKAGTQTCIGALGSCDGQVKPAAQEDCFNDIDDDCDGKVEQRLPRPPDDRDAARAHGARQRRGGRAVLHPLPGRPVRHQDGGLRRRERQALGGIDIYCATPNLVRGATAYTVTETPSATPLTAHATNITPADTATFDCGTAGFVPAWYVDGTADTLFSDSIGSSCATTVLTLAANNQLSFSFTKQAGGGNYYGYINLGTAYEDPCNNGEVLIGFDGRKGSGMDETQAVCAPLQVVYK